MGRNPSWFKPGEAGFKRFEKRGLGKQAGEGRTYGRQSKESPKACPECGKQGRVDQSQKYKEHVYRRYICVCTARWTTYEVAVAPEEINAAEEKPLGEKIRAHIETCRKCTIEAACWHLKGFFHQLFESELKVKQKVLIGEPPAAAPVIVVEESPVQYYNPTCTHERTPFGASSCADCQAFTEEVLKLKVSHKEEKSP